jgi:hypothetical protein
VRAEQDDLRAIATPIGAGIRAPAYDATLTTQNYAVYLQDRWQILSNLYLHGGVRWEMQDMRDLLGRRNVFIWDNVGPRVSLSYDWTDEGKSRLYAGYGWFFNQLPVLLNSRAFGGLVNVTRTYRNSDCRTPTIGGQPRSDKAENPTEYCGDVNSSTTGLTAGSVVPNLKGMYTQQFQVGYEQEIVEDLTVGVHWLHTDLARTVEDISTNGGLNYLIANPGESVSSRRPLAPAEQVHRPPGAVRQHRRGGPRQGQRTPASSSTATSCSTPTTASAATSPSRPATTTPGPSASTSGSPATGCSRPATPTRA